MGGVVIDQLPFRFLICRSVPEIFAIKVESCQKSRKILDVFLPSQILGASLPKIVPNCTPGSRLVVWIKICDGIPISSEFIDVYTLNFKPNFKFSRLKNVWAQRGCCTPGPVTTWMGDCLWSVRDIFGTFCYLYFYKGVYPYLPMATDAPWSIFWGMNKKV